MGSRENGACTWGVRERWRTARPAQPLGLLGARGSSSHGLKMHAGDPQSSRRKYVPPMPSRGACGSWAARNPCAAALTIAFTCTMAAGVIRPEALNQYPCCGSTGNNYAELDRFPREHLSKHGMQQASGRARKRNHLLGAASRFLVGYSDRNIRDRLPPKSKLLKEHELAANARDNVHK